jgi:flavin reductase (DIM6/NTAB) family NADH-FMN oxidoreductase RutF
MSHQGAAVSKRILEPNTTLFPVPVVLITSGAETPNVMTCNRIASCSAEPPRLALSVRPARHSHTLIRQSGKFVVNLPTSGQATLCDYLGVVTGRDEDRIGIAGLTLAPAARVRTPLLAECPVNIEFTVEQAIELDSHTLFIARVEAVHVEEALLGEQGDVDLAKATGLTYDCGTVRERPTYGFRVEDLRRAARGDGNLAVPRGKRPTSG